MTDRFSVLSYNIQAGIGTSRAHHYVTRAHHQLLPAKRKQRTLSAIGKYTADFDVVCLQEVDLGGRRSGFRNQVEALTKASGHPHAVFQENRQVRNISRHGNAILSRFPIVNIEDVKLPGRIAGRGALIVELDMEPATTIACVHLSLGEEDQRAQLAFLSDFLSSPGRHIVCGDMNCTAGSAPMSEFCERTGLRPLTGSAHKTFPSWAPRLAIDHILTDLPDRTDKAEVGDITLSDHRPVSAEFSANILRDKKGQYSPAKAS